MPELPEVETVRRQLAPIVTEREITKTFQSVSEKFYPTAHTQGTQILGLRRRGKYLIFELDTEEDLVVHLGMTGVLAIEPSHTAAHTKPSEKYGTNTTGYGPHERARWVFDNGQVMTYVDVRQFGRIKVVPHLNYSSINTLSKLGPEPLGDDFDPDGFYRALKASKRKIKTQLLSQIPVAGVGNIYADEALWIAKIHPASRTVSRKRAHLLARAITESLTQGVKNGGTTLRDYRDASGNKGSNQSQLLCYGRAELPCLRCAQPLSKTTVDGRGTTFCKQCQTR